MDKRKGEEDQKENNTTENAKYQNESRDTVYRDAMMRKKKQMLPPFLLTPPRGKKINETHLEFCCANAELDIMDKEGAARNQVDTERVDITEQKLELDDC